MGDEKCFVVQPFAEERVGEGQHHRRVGIGANGEPFRVEGFSGVVAQRADRYELDPGIDNFLLQIERIVAREAALVDLAVFRCHLGNIHRSRARRAVSRLRGHACRRGDAGRSDT